MSWSLMRVIGFSLFVIAQIILPGVIKWSAGLTFFDTTGKYTYNEIARTQKRSVFRLLLSTGCLLCFLQSLFKLKRHLLIALLAQWLHVKFMKFALEI